MGSRVRVSSGPPTKEKRGFDIFETSFVFLLSTCKKYDYLLLVVSEDRLTIDNLSPFTVNYAKSPNFQIIAYFCRCEHFEIKYLYIQCYSADSLLAQIVLFISQKPFRLPFLRSIMPFSVRLIVMVLTVLSDLPMCVAISFCVAFGRSCKKFSTAISSKVQFKVQNLHFGATDPHDAPHRIHHGTNYLSAVM